MYRLVVMSFKDKEEPIVYVLPVSVAFPIICYRRISDFVSVGNWQIDILGFHYQVDLTFSPESLLAIARLAMERKTGARGLRAIMVSYSVQLLHSNVCSSYYFI
jgi:hypothetical protein